MLLQTLFKSNLLKYTTRHIHRYIQDIFVYLIYLFIFTLREFSHKRNTRNTWGRTVFLLFMQTLRIYGNAVIMERTLERSKIEGNPYIELAGYPK